MRVAVFRGVGAGDAGGAGRTTKIDCTGVQPHCESFVGVDVSTLEMFVGKGASGEKHDEEIVAGSKR